MIVRARNGDIAAFEDIYRATSAFVYNVALRVTNNSNDADEVTQDVFVKVHRSLGSFAFRSSFKTWIYRIAANTAINHAKASARHRNRKVEYDPEIHDIEAPDLTRGPLEREDAEKAIRSLLGELGPDQRACIVLREIEGLDYRTIAKMLSIKINTVRSRLKRAREHLAALGRKG